MKISTGTPPVEGRYLAFVQCEPSQVREWIEPIIAAWHGGRWHAPRPVLGWVGPIPPMKVAALAAQVFDAPPAYDL